MGLEQLGLAVIWEVTNGIASILGLIFVLIGWIKISVATKTEHNRRMSLPLSIFSLAVVTFPISIGIYQKLPYSMQDRYIYGERLGVVYYLAFDILSLLLLIVSLASVYWDTSAAKRVV